jgi:two-component system, cell cycle sensor histidine kinase and response regulator CckA
MVRKLAADILQEKGYQVLVGKTGEEAIRICREHEGHIDLLLTDVVMPSMNGRKLAERIRVIQNDIKMVYMSGYTDDSIVHHGVLAPGTDFLQKPFTAETLSSKIREVLGKTVHTNEEVSVG